MLKTSSAIPNGVRKLSDRFNYNLMFSDLIDRPKIRAQFIPFGVGGIDPFDSFMDSQGWRSKQGWNPASAGIINDCTGSEGASGWRGRFGSARRRSMQTVNMFEDNLVSSINTQMVNSWHKDKYRIESEQS